MSKHIWDEPEPDETQWEAKARTAIRWAVCITAALAVVALACNGLSWAR